jgi:hypothetical protein
MFVSNDEMVTVGGGGCIHDCLPQRNGRCDILTQVREEQAYEAEIQAQRMEVYEGGPIPDSNYFDHDGVGDDW